MAPGIRLRLNIFNPTVSPRYLASLSVCLSSPQNWLTEILFAVGQKQFFSPTAQSGSKER